MKDYIDKLREDYHRKNIQKLAFGDKFKEFGNNILSKYNDIRYGIDNTPEQNVNINNPSLNTKLGSINTVQNTSSLPSLPSTAQIGLGVDRSVSLNPNMSQSEKDLISKGEETKTMLSNIASLGEGSSPVSTYSGKEKPSFVKGSEANQKDKKSPTGFFIPPSGDLTTNLYNLGRAIGEKKGTPGRGLAITANAGAATLEGARALMSGVGFSKAQGYTDQYNQQQMIDARKKYESNPQYKNTNYMGGPTQTRSGGTIRIYEDGGEQQMDPMMQQMMAQQQGQVDPRMQQEMDPRMAEQQQQMDPRMQQQQETKMNQQEAQAYQQIAEKLVSSFETIEEIADYLNENGVDEVAFNAIIKFAQDMMEDKEESADDNEEATEEPEEGEGEMRKGGKKFNKKVGEYIEFEYGGKTYKGTIKSIKNGQIFLK